MSNEAMPSSLRLALWSDHVKALQTTEGFPFDGDIVSKVCEGVAVDTVGMDDDALRAHITALKTQCTACKEAREVVDEWLEQRSLLWTTLGEEIEERYEFFTGKLSLDDITGAYGGAAEIERSRWTERVLWLSMRARVHPEKVVDALKKKSCVRCGSSPAATCVANMCGACCHGRDCLRHSKNQGAASRTGP
jgi:hypothetical protein